MQWSSLLRYGASRLCCLVVYLALLRPVKKHLITAFRELPGRIATRREASRMAAGNRCGQLPRTGWSTR